MRLADLTDLPGKVIRNAASGYAGFVIRTATSILLIRFLVQHLGTARFGLYELLAVILGYFQLLELGMMPAVVRYVSHHHARDERSEVRAVVGSALLLLLLVSALLVPVTALLAATGPSIFEEWREHPRLLSTCIWIVGLGAIIAFLRRLFTAILEGHQEFPLLNLCGVSGALLGALLSVAVVRRGHEIPALLVVLVVQLGYEAAFSLVVLVRRHELMPDPRLGRRDVVRKLAGYSSLAFLIDLSLTVSHRIDGLVIGLFLPSQAIGHYSLGIKIPRTIESATDPLVDTFFPLASEMHAGAEPAALRRLLTSGTRVSLLIAAPGLALAAWHGADLLRWWLGAHHVQPSLPVLHVFLAIVGLSVFEATAGRILLGMGKVRFDAMVSVASAAVNIGLSLLLVRPYGIVGVAIGTLVPAFVGKALVSVPYTCALTGTPLATFLVQAVGPGAAIAGTALAFMAATRGLLPPFPVFVLNTAFATVVTLAVGYRTRPRPA